MTDKKNYKYRQTSTGFHVDLKKGEPPGTLIYVGDKKNNITSITAIQYKEDKVLEYSATTIDELKSKLQPGFTTWINIDGIHDSRVINDAGAAFELENLSLEDIMNTTGRPKFEEFEGYIYIVIKDLHCPKESDFGLEQMSIIIKDDLLITFQEEKGDVFDGVRSRIRGGTSKVRSRGVDYLAYSLMDAVIDNYFVVAESFDHYLDNLEDLLYATTHRRQLTKIKEAKKHFNTLKRTIHPMKEMVYNLYRTEHKLIAKRTHIYIRDIYDHITNIEDTLDQSRDKVYGLMGIYQSGTNNTMNNIVKTLTIVSTIFMALSLIAGIYGMNFKHMPELEWQFGYFGALGVMAIVAIGLIIYFRFKKWI